MDEREKRYWIWSWEPGLSPDSGTDWLVIMGNSLNLSDLASSSVEQGRPSSLAYFIGLLQRCAEIKCRTALLVGLGLLPRRAGYRRQSGQPEPSGLQETGGAGGPLPGHTAQYWLLSLRTGDLKCQGSRPRDLTSPHSCQPPPARTEAGNPYWA